MYFITKIFIRCGQIFLTNSYTTKQARQEIYGTGLTGNYSSILKSLFKSYIAFEKGIESPFNPTIPCLEIEDLMFDTEKYLYLISKNFFQYLVGSWVGFFGVFFLFRFFRVDHIHFSLNYANRYN